MLGLGLGVTASQAVPMARYSIGGFAPAVVAAPAAGVYGVKGGAVAFDALFSFSRLSAAWKRNALGHWVKVVAGEPRTGHHIWKSGKLIPAGILMEADGGVNLALFSEDFTNAAWETIDASYANITRTPNSADGPRGSNTATKLTVASSFKAVNSYIAQSLNIGGTFPYTVSAYMKAAEYSHGVLSVGFYGSGYFAIFDLSSGVISTAPTASGVTAKIEFAGGGWYRCSITSYVAGLRLILITASSDNSLNSASDGTSGIHIDLAQGGFGGNTSSYKPTFGSQVSVAAESIQIDPVTLAKAGGVFGPELIMNGGFDTDTVWLGGGGSGWSISGGMATHTPGTSGRIYQAVAAAQDRYHLFTLDVSGITAGGANMTLLGEGAALTSLSNGPNYFIIESGSINQDFQVYANADFDGSIDNISVREISMPEGLTFLMKGTMTRAKEPVSFSNAIPMQWVLSPSFTEILVSTNAAHTGKALFRHQFEGSLQLRGSADDGIALGVEVPFSLGFVVGATEIEGFLDGVSTGTITHGGIANLLAAPLKLLPVGTGTLEEFRIWTEALPSAAMIAVTS